MSDQAQPVDQLPKPTPFALTAELVDGAAPVVIAQGDPDTEGYVADVLDGPYDGWAYNDDCRIRLHGQSLFQLAGAGTLVFDVPPDLAE